MSRTQNQSLKEIKSHAQTKRDEILRFIQLNPGLSRRDIADKMDILLNSLTARVKELIDEGSICERGTKKCQVTNKEVALLWPGQKERQSEYDIESKREIKKVFKLLAKIQKENQKKFEQTLRVINQYFHKKSGQK